MSSTISSVHNSNYMMFVTSWTISGLGIFPKYAVPVGMLSCHLLTLCCLAVCVCVCFFSCSVFLVLCHRDRV